MADLARVHLHTPLTRTDEPVSARRDAIRRLAESEPSDRRAQTQARLVEAGVELIAEQSLGSTSVGDICSRAGFTRGAFYSNFTDMDHFVRQLAEQEWELIARFIDAALEQGLAELAAEGREARPAQLPSDEDLRADIADLTDRILGALPVSRQFYLLQSEYTSYLIRHTGEEGPLQEGYAEFKERMGEFLESGLALVGREPILSVQDTAAIILATASQSVQIALTEGDENLTALLERSLPMLLTSLSRPITASTDPK